MQADMPSFSVTVPASILRWLSALTCCAGISLLMSCGGSATSSPSTSTLLSGRFVDSAVSGLSYLTSSQVAGITRSDGGFDYNKGDTITFKLGAVEFPVVTADTLVTPLDMVPGATSTDTLTNIAYFLQALDADDNPYNGITLGASLAKQATQAVNFTQTVDAFVKDPVVTALIKAKGTASTTTAQSALTHVNASLLQGVIDGSLPAPSTTCMVPNQGSTSTEMQVLRAVMAKGQRTALSARLWSELQAKPTSPSGWFFGATLSPRGDAPDGSFEVYRPTLTSDEVLLAKRSGLWNEAYSMAQDVWLKHRDNAHVLMRISALKRYGSLVNQPDYVGNALFLHYTGDKNTYLELIFEPESHPAVFFNGIGGSSLYQGTLGINGKVFDTDDGLFQPGYYNDWAQRHRPGDVNFPPNLNQGGTTESGRQVGDGTCVIPAGGLAMLWMRPSNRVDLFFSTIGVTNFYQATAPLYTDAQGYQGNVGIRTLDGLVQLNILRP